MSGDQLPRNDEASRRPASPVSGSRIPVGPLGVARRFCWAVLIRCQPISQHRPLANHPHLRHNKAVRPRLSVGNALRLRLALLVLAFSFHSVSLADDRLPVPDKAAQQEAAAIVQDVFGDQIKAAAKPDEKLALMFSKVTFRIEPRW